MDTPTGHLESGPRPPCQPPCEQAEGCHHRGKADY
jgi:hypothetical protein